MSLVMSFLFPFPLPIKLPAKNVQRLLLVLTLNNQQRPDLIVIAVTSKISSNIQFGEMIIVDWLSAGLLKSSMIKPVITTLEKPLIIKRLGKLKELDSQSLKSLLNTILSN